MAAMLAGVFLCGCSYNKLLGTVKHVDGSGSTTYRVIGAGGFMRPGVIVVVSQTLGSNPPVVLTQASGAPIAPGFLGAPAQIAEAAILARGLRDRDNHDKVTVRTVSEPIPDDPPPPPPPPPPQRPPGHRPKDNGNRGR